MTGPTATPFLFAADARREFALTDAPAIPGRGEDGNFTPDKLRVWYRQNKKGLWRVRWVEFSAGDRPYAQTVSLNSLTRAEQAEHAWAKKIAEAHMPEGRVK